MRVKCLAQGHNAVPRPGLEPRLFDQESSALPVRQPQADVNFNVNEGSNCLLNPSPRVHLGGRTLVSSHDNPRFLA